MQKAVSGADNIRVALQHIAHDDPELPETAVSLVLTWASEVGSIVRCAQHRERMS